MEEFSLRASSYWTGGVYHRGVTNNVGGHLLDKKPLFDSGHTSIRSFTLNGKLFLPLCVTIKCKTLTTTRSDIALIKNNSQIGSSIAVELCRLRKLKENKDVVSVAWKRHKNGFILHVISANSQWTVVVQI